MTAALACPRCAAELRPSAKFCDECGSPTAVPSTPAEYKQVTVLFADVVHSMDIAAAVGAERLREIMTELVTRAATVVQRFSGTVDKFTGDGIMAVFGAPVALEDHAVRACLAALGIQEEVTHLTADVAGRDGVDLQLRVGLNSGQVIAGEIGSTALGYTAIGEQVGMAQRMESVAPPGGVMLSDSTARLVEGAAVLGEPELVRIKGADQPVPARQLLSVAAQRAAVSESTLVGREWELGALAAIMDRSMAGHGCVVGVVGPPGIGKTRLTAEVARLAKSRGIEVFSTYCESHAADIPFHVVARLLRATGRLGGLEDQDARAQARAQFPDADPQDLVLLDDLVGIADPNVELPKIDPDARRRRLTALINTAHLARDEPAVFVVEDAHWIDDASESMLADFLALTPQTSSLVVITYRPEYRGALSHLTGAQTIALAPLSDAQTSALIAQLLGPDQSVAQIGRMIAGRAAGNPFFAEEITRELAQRGVLLGERGSYTCRADVGDVSVPATLQATIAARIDRLGPAAKHTLAAAAVIGARFNHELLATLKVEPIVDQLIAAELVDQVRFNPRAEYAFRHPLIRTVAYESQLKSDRARLHRRLAAAIEAEEPAAADQNAALIAEHLEAAGDLHAAYGWHMRAATWATNRDISAARLSWDRATKIADALPADDPNHAAMRIAPRTMLCGTAFRVHVDIPGARFEELRQLCTAADDKASLAIATAGLVADHAYQGRVLEASQLASEAWALIESIGDPDLTVGLSIAPIYSKMESGNFSDMLRWSQRVIDLADGDPSKGNLISGSPLPLALTTRAIGRYCLGRPGWRDDLRQGIAMARRADPLIYAAAVTYACGVAILTGVLRPDDSAIREIEDALHSTERSADDFALAHAQVTLGAAMVHRQTGQERDRGQQILADVREVFLRDQHHIAELPLVDVLLAREKARRGELDAAIPLMRDAVDHLVRRGQLLAWGVVATGVLVETLLERGAHVDLWEAEAAIERLATAPTDVGLATRDILLLRLRALLARARDDAAAYADLRDRYREMANSLGFEGHIEWAREMP
ncbi:adenylate/guanylate cyclase domain-containing protein [Mycobacterium sp. 1245805.9]|uniref:ATP-binding protein n=1 Tax=Mycobacterium sp. 1245805.9 TaxID=1856862 RepID=UPI0007FD2EDB|nr:adenylate/guanylate cyclase domain-containing protein [Mycobacterium sp. 1245805.9]OBI88687.1 cyclase [Mycobacterium sp. 1245805.9]